MLNEIYINSLIEPIIKRQKELSSYIISVITKRINDIGKLDKSEVYKLLNNSKSSNDIKVMYDTLSKIHITNTNEITTALKMVAHKTYNETKPYYEYRDIEFLSIDENIAIKEIMDNKIKEIVTLYLKSTQSPKIFVMNPKFGTFEPMTIQHGYNTLVDKGLNNVSLGGYEYDRTMINDMRQLSNGLQIVEDNRAYSLDSYTSTLLLDGISEMCQEIQNGAGQQFGSDGVELSAHQFPAPDHALVQGHIFSNEEFEKMQNGEDTTDIYGETFIGFERPIGAWNCRHYTNSIKEYSAKVSQLNAEYKLFRKISGL